LQFKESDCPERNIFKFFDQILIDFKFGLLPRSRAPASYRQVFLFYEPAERDRVGNSDADFVNLMLPHHQAAIDMARTELLNGSDTQMRRLAQEILPTRNLKFS